MLKFYILSNRKRRTHRFIIVSEFWAAGRHGGPIAVLQTVSRTPHGGRGTQWAYPRKGRESNL